MVRCGRQIGIGIRKQVRFPCSSYQSHLLFKGGTKVIDFSGDDTGNIAFFSSSFWAEPPTFSDVWMVAHPYFPYSLFTRFTIQSAIQFFSVTKVVYKTNKHTLVLSRGWQHVLMPILADFCVGCFTLASSSNSTHSLCNFCFGAVVQTFLRQLRAEVSLFYFKLRRWAILPIELKRYTKYGW